MLLGVDTGGTFTDFVLLGDEDGGRQVRLHKTLSTPEAPERAILEGIRELGLTAAVAAGRLRIVHGSTVATNAALERKGVRTAYVTNRGLGDVLTLARQNRAELYDLTPPATPPPVPPELCIEVPVRLDASGREVETLTAAATQELVAAIEALDPEAIAINLLYAWLDPGQELALEAALESAAPGRRFISRSSFVLPQYREYERGIATWLNAWLGPRVEGYLQRLQTGLAPSPLAIMQSSGGTMAATVASRRAVNLLVSGPAGGLAGAAAVAAAAGIDSLLTFDMGGTSTDVAVIDGEFELTSEGRLGPWPVAIPMLDIHTIGAGGGSIASIDAGGALQVGPQSAGAMPGPACYGRGGSAATVTDAHVVLGQLPASAALGGSLALDTAAAEAAVAKVAAALGSDLHSAARGILDVANEHMAQALRVMSIERGRDPRGLVLCCFGGAGGLHLCDLAEALGMEQAMVPSFAGVLSALGMLVARPERQLLRSLRRALDDIEPGELETVEQELIAAGRAELEQEGAAADGLEEETFLELRYRGQAYALTLPLANDHGEIARRFHHEHAHRYGHALGTPIEVVNLRVRLRARGEQLELPELAAGPEASPRHHVLLADCGSERVPVYQREELRTGQQLDGPALVTESTATSLIRPGWQARVDRIGNLLLTRAGAG